MAKKKPAEKISKIKAEQAKQLNNTADQIRKLIEEKENTFNEDPLRFIPIRIDNIATTLDLSSPWFLVERRLAKANITSPNRIEEYKKRNKSLCDMAYELNKLRKDLRREESGTAYRRQPVLKEQGDWILSQAGEFRNPKSIHEELTKKMGFNISLQTVRSFIAENKTVLDKYREDFKNELLNTSISTDSGRLKFWEESFNYYYNQWKNYGKIGDFNACAKIINEVRTEVKGDVTIRIDGKIDINHSIEVNKSLGQKLGELNIAMINIALAAQKSGVNPLPLLTQLSNSFYNKWNGITEEPLGLKDKSKLIPVSNFVKSYNWDEIREKNKEDFDHGTIQDATIVKDEKELQLIEERKNMLLNLLRSNDKTKLKSKSG